MHGILRLISWDEYLLIGKKELCGIFSEGRTNRG